MVVIVLTNEENKRMHIDICFFSSTIILIFILFLEFSCKWWTMGKQLVNFITCGCESSAPFL
jgi:hypothetical protein